MKYLLVVIALAALALAEEPVLRHYHENVGIAAAARIKQAEQALDFDGSRIVGGSVAAAGAHPHLVGLVITLATGATSVCGATMLSNTYTVTAAHCWWDGRNQARQFQLVFGSAFLFHGGQRLNSNTVYMHSNWRPADFANNLAMILHFWVPYDNVIQRAILPSGNQLDNNFWATWASAAGYGKIDNFIDISNNQAKSHVSLQVIRNEDCARSYGNLVIDSTLCTSGANFRGTCAGDTGGPLTIANRVLIGISSFSPSNCQFGLPSGFSRVTSFVNWINMWI